MGEFSALTEAISGKYAIVDKKKYLERVFIAKDIFRWDDYGPLVNAVVDLCEATGTPINYEDGCNVNTA